MGKAESLEARKQQYRDAESLALDDFGGGMFDDGVASVPPVIGADPDEQTKIDAAVAQAVGPLNEQLASLQSQIQKDADDLSAEKLQHASDVEKVHGEMDAALADLNVQLGAAVQAKQAEDEVVKGFQAKADELQGLVDKLKAFFQP